MLRLLLFRDFICYISIVCLFLLPSPYGSFLLIAALAGAIPRLAKAIRETNGELGKSEKYLYLGFNAVCVGILLILLFQWAARHNNKTAWLIASVAAFVLVVLLLGTVMTVHGGYRNLSVATVKTAIAWFVGCVVVVGLVLEFWVTSRPQGMMAPLNLVPFLVTIGLLIGLVLWRRRHPIIGVSRFGIVMLILALIFFFIAMLLRH